jgi:hypothetical protein
MQRISTSSFFLVLLISASVYALARSADLATDSTIGATSPASVATVRGYYAEVQEFFETGDITGIRAMVDPRVFGGEGMTAGPEDLEFHLRGLRGTYPALTFSIEEITGSGSTVIAQLWMDSGGSPAVPVAPLTSVRTWRQIETLQVSDGRIVEWQSNGLLSGIFLSNPGSVQPFPMHIERTLVAARMSFAEGSSGQVSLHAPAMIVPEQGSLLLLGNGVSMVFGSENREVGRLTESGIEVTVRPGESIFVPQGRAILRAGESMPATALVVLFIPDESESSDRELHGEYPAPEQLLADQSAGQVGRGVSIAPLSRAAVSTRGELELIVGVVRIEPLSGMGLDRGIEPVLVLPQLGRISMQWDRIAQRRMLANEGHATATAWVVAVRSVSVE